jgi:hypothetical protein
MGVLLESFCPAHIDDLLVLCRNCHGMYDKSHRSGTGAASCSLGDYDSPFKIKMLFKDWAKLHHVRPFVLTANTP